MTSVPAKVGRPKKQPGDPIRHNALSPRVKTALSLMVEHNLDIKEAAIAAGMRPESLKLALRRPPAMSYYAFLTETLKRGSRHHAVHAIIGEMRHSKNSMAKIAAARTILEGGEADGLNRPQPMAPGVTIVIQAPAEPPRGVTIEQTPAIDVEPPHHWPSVD